MDTIAITPLVNVSDPPKAEFCVSPPIAPISDPVFAFCDLWSSDVVNWIWNFGDGTPLDSSSTNPVHSYSATIGSNDYYNYTISLYVQNKYGCWDTISHPVEITPEFTFYIPNTFTPNGDQTNEFFFGKGRGIKEYNILLFDRWGNTIWECHYEGKSSDWDNTNQDGMPSACKWDGVVQSGGTDQSGSSGVVVQEDVYVWKVNLTDVFNRKHLYVGHVSIVK
jgi:gliding motility-associated-like protein